MSGAHLSQKKLSSPKEVGGGVSNQRQPWNMLGSHRDSGGSVRVDMPSSWTYEPMRMDYAPDCEHRLAQCPSLRLGVATYYWAEGLGVVAFGASVVQGT